MIRRASILGALSAAVLVVACHARERTPTIPGHDGYRVQQDVALAAAGLPNARLQLLEDARVTPAMRIGFQRGVPDDMCRRPPTDSIHSFCTEISHRPLRSALLRLVDTSAAELDTTVLDRPIANVVLAIPSSERDPAIYGVTVDLTADAGSYSGPLLELLDLKSRRLARLQARDVVSDSLVDILLPTNQKTGWQIVPADDGIHHEILMVACRPSFENNGTGFTVTYTRFYVDGTEWKRRERRTRGFWENQGAFPDRTSFP